MRTGIGADSFGDRESMDRYLSSFKPVPYPLRILDWFLSMMISLILIISLTVCGSDCLIFV